MPARRGIWQRKRGELGDTGSTAFPLQAYAPEHQVRWRLRKNSVAIWDNRCTQHYAVQDFWPAVRNLERAGIVGDRPA